jgi:hypothetical protein
MEPEIDIFEEWGDKKVSILTRIKWKLEEIRNIPRNLKEGITKLIYWFPVIWNDRDWDHIYIYNILEHKLKAQSKYIGSRDIHTRAQRDAETMMTCVRLLEKDRDSYYELEHMDYYKDKNWFEPVKGEDNFEWKSKPISNTFQEYFAKYPLIYKRVLNGEGPYSREGREDDEKIIAMNISQINQNRAHKLLFKILEKNIQRWWD